LKSSIENHIGKLHHVLVDEDLVEDINPFNKMAKVRIARVTLAFRNSDIITLLEERGQIIGEGKLEKLAEVDIKINEVMHN
jgi:hypothetical protein